MIKPLNKPESVKIISNQLQNPNKPNFVNSSQSRANLTNSNRKPSQNFNQDKKTFENNTIPPIKSPAKPPIQLIAKPKNIITLGSILLVKAIIAKPRNVPIPLIPHIIPIID